MSSGFVSGVVMVAASAGARAIYMLAALAMSMGVALADVVAIDGDTLRLDGVTHRLYGIDAPERAQVCPDGWPAGREAAAHLAGLVGGRTVECHQVERDRYGRPVSACYAAGVDLSAAMVGAGMALAFVRYSAQYVDAERRAAARGSGLHAHDCAPAWEWRARQRQ